MIATPKTMRRIAIFTGLVLALMMGCAGSSQQGAPQVATGMDAEGVTRLLGEPSRREVFAPDRFVFFYDEGPYENRPVCFDRQRVVHVGPELLAGWRDERMATATGKDGGALSRKAKDRVKATLSAERQARIAALERKVKPLPVSATADNLRIYRELLSLAPDNARYRRKVAFYQERHRTEKAAQQKAAQLAAQRRLDEERQRRNQQLRVYEGNQQVQMALHQLGRGALYLWLKNLSDKSLSLEAGHYHMLDPEGGTIPLQVSVELQGRLAPGGIAYGKLTYSEEVSPERLRFDHPGTGAIEKRFPSTD